MYLLDLPEATTISAVKDLGFRYGNKLFFLKIDISMLKMSSPWCFLDFKIYLKSDLRALFKQRLADIAAMLVAKFRKLK